MFHIVLKCQVEIFVACAFPPLSPFVSEVPTEPVQGNCEAPVDMLIIQAKQAKLPYSHLPCRIAQKGKFCHHGEQ